MIALKREREELGSGARLDKLNTEDEQGRGAERYELVTYSTDAVGTNERTCYNSTGGESY